MHQTILVTGATGTVGREVVKQLSLLDDVRVRAGVHSVIKGENLKRIPGVEVVEIEFTNPESLHAAFTNADKMFLITPFVDNQVEMSKVLIDEAKRAGVKHIVKLSALGADNDEGVQLMKWHREIEDYIKQSGIPYTFLRPTSFMQNFVNYNSQSIKEENAIYMPVGKGKVAYIDVRDIAAVGVEVIRNNDHAGKAYDLTGPETLSLQDVAAIMSEVTGKPVSYIDVPEDAARNAMEQGGLPQWLMDSMMELNAYYKAGKGENLSQEIEEIIGRKPHTFRKFVQDYKECFV